MKKIVIIGGDPNSVNSELIYKVWKNSKKKIRNKIYLVSNYKLLTQQFRKLKFPIKLTKINNLNENISEDYLKIIDINLSFKNPFKVSRNSASKFFIKCLNYVHKNCLNSNISGFINCPIDKLLLNKKGVTEYLAKKCEVKNNSEVMLITSKNFAVCPITTHLNINSISRNITQKKIINKIITINNWFKKYKNKKPKLAILGLNPHNAEFDNKSEEVKIILPALKKLKKKNIKINGPFAADTFFIEDFKKYDVTVGMFHDQVITPFKTLFGFEAINITLGLKYIRISPDHGVAKNLIGKNKANHKSLLSCVNFINKF